MADRINVKSMLRRHGLRPKKTWSQNFLVDLGVLQEIVAAAALDPDDVVVELGAGLGSLTALLARDAARVIAVERDRDLARVLRGEFAGDGKVEILEANAATLDWRALCARLGRRPVVVGNLPYHMASQIMFHLLDAGDDLSRWLLMIQREMARRVVAGPGSRAYGVLGILMQMRADVESVLTVGSDAFLPQPRVVSEVIRGRPLPASRHAMADGAMFERLVRGVFNQRRKMVRNGLRSTFGTQLVDAQIDALLAENQVDPAVRPEQLPLQTLVDLANGLTALLAAGEPEADAAGGGDQ